MERAVHMNVGNKENIDEIPGGLYLDLILRVLTARQIENIVGLDIMYLIIKINRGITILKEDKLIPIKGVLILDGFVRVDLLI